MKGTPATAGATAKAEEQMKRELHPLAACAEALRRLNCSMSLLTFAAGIAAVIVPFSARAEAIQPAFETFLLTNGNADGTVMIANDGLSFLLTGGNNGSGLPGSTIFIGIAPNSGSLEFMYAYSSLDTPGFDSASYFDGNNVVQLADTDGMSGVATITVGSGDSYGWRVDTVDNSGEPGLLTVTVAADQPSVAPEPSPALMVLIGLPLIFVARRRNAGRRSGVLHFGIASLMFLTAALSTGLKCEAQVQTRYIGANVTGQLSLTRTVPLSGTPTASASRSAVLGANAVAEPRIQQTGNEVSRLPSVFPHPPLTAPGQKSAAAAKSRLENVTPDILNQQGPLTVASGAPVFGFEGLSHFDQRNANNGNQFSVEPPSPSIAAANGMILEGVNNAVQVFNAQSGAAASRVVSSNELFGVAPAIDRNTGINGVFPTDMRVFYDADTNRWMVLQRSQDNDIFGDPLDESHLYLAVSQTADPTGNYNVYVMDTTNGSNPGCPCLPDFPQIGADQYGFYVSANEYNTSSQQFVDAEIFAFSKLGLASGAQSPAAYRFLLPQISGFEFAIQPATTPEAAGASYFLASGGVEYFLSSQSESSSSNQLGVWAMSNTASLQGANPSLLLTQTPINALAYVYPDIAVQRSGPLPYGSSLSPPGALAFLDGGIDSRILSLVYSGGRLFATFAAQISDNISRSVVGGEYVILSPTFRNTILSAPVLTQGLLSAPGNDHLLRPAIAVNAQGSGAIAFTLVGPDYFPSAAFVPINVAGGPTAIQIAGPGVAPEDGFTGYPGGPFPGVARWGDYSTSTVDANGNIWMATEYIPSGPRTQLANWGTYIAKYVP